jgi:transposase
VAAKQCGNVTKWLVEVDGQGVPLACHLDSATSAEVKPLERTLDNIAVQSAEETDQLPRPQRLVCDKGYENDKLRERLLMERDVDLICPHRGNLKRALLQDGRKLKRHKQRRKVERTFALLGNFRRLVVRYERSLKRYRAFFHVECLIITLRKS